MANMEKRMAQDTEIVQSHHPEPVKTLWMLVCHTQGNDTYQLVPFYAFSEEDAEQQVQHWLSKQSCSTARISLRSFPDGFVICRQRLRGTMV